MSFKLTIILTILLFYPTAILAEQKVRVIGHYGTDWASEEGVGFAQEIFRRITKLADYPNELEAYPIKRAIKVFYFNDSD